MPFCRTCLLETTFTGSKVHSDWSRLLMALSIDIHVWTQCGVSHTYPVWGKFTLERILWDLSEYTSFEVGRLQAYMYTSLKPCVWRVRNCLHSNHANFLCHKHIQRVTATRRSLACFSQSCCQRANIAKLRTSSRRGILHLLSYHTINVLTLKRLLLLFFLQVPSTRCITVDFGYFVVHTILALAQHPTQSLLLLYDFIYERKPTGKTPTPCRHLSERKTVNSHFLAMFPSLSLLCKSRATTLPCKASDVSTQNVPPHKCASLIKISII